jgi:hypothetical protein
MFGIWFRDKICKNMLKYVYKTPLTMQPRRIMRNLWMKLDETFVTGAFAPRPSAQASRLAAMGLAWPCDRML